MYKKHNKKSFDEIKILQTNFIMVYIIYKISGLLKIIRISKTVFKEYNKRLFFEKINNFSHNI